MGSPPPRSPRKRAPDSNRNDQREAKRQTRNGPNFNDSSQQGSSNVSLISIAAESHDKSQSRIRFDEHTTPISIGSRNDGNMAVEEHETEDHDQDFNVEDDEMSSDWSDCASEVVNAFTWNYLLFPRPRLSPVAFVMKMSYIITWYS